ncbi:hypothetical protein [Pantoea sp. SJZ147]|uniref:hypothetical protein n=1 Tax=Pantoea sp. SJZ147 TaxID=2572896 RepID=UPI000EC0A3DF|nr:hypothetical protein [Pantoea sp. SJZ147]TWD40690.1 hypothetical protein FBY13_105131 [Pantoea sp. SJZ147]HCP26009.1 hypothetical protein [Pantoea ananatis]
MTSKSQKIFDKLCEVYPGAMDTITSLSFNSDGKKNFIISDEVGFNYDKVVNHSICYDNGLKEKSPDALFIAEDILYFVEFKEGSAKKDDIRMKIHEGITTLFCFVIKYLPEISREDFFNLDIRYAVVMRGFRATGRQGFLDSLEASSKKFNLKNIEGFLVSQTTIRDEPGRILALLNKVSSGKISSIQINLPDSSLINVLI